MLSEAVTRLYCPDQAAAAEIMAHTIDAVGEEMRGDGIMARLTFFIREAFRAGAEAALMAFEFDQATVMAEAERIIDEA